MRLMRKSETRAAPRHRPAEERETARMQSALQVAVSGMEEEVGMEEREAAMGMEYKENNGRERGRERERKREREREREE